MVDMDGGLYDVVGRWEASGWEGRVCNDMVERGEQVVRVRDVRKGVG